jgi:hypothetical protein
MSSCHCRKSYGTTVYFRNIDKVPEIVKMDNGPPFNGQSFTDFSHYLGFKHRKITPY